jgi:hypothetical protein
MTAIVSKRSWNKIRERLIQRYPLLTKENLKHDEHNEEQFIGDLEAKLDKTNEEVRDLLREL